MKNNKHTGSYYTPDYLARFIVNYVAPYFKSKKEISIFEPSVGDGRFVKAFNDVVFPSKIRNFSFTAIEKNGLELLKAEVESKRDKKGKIDYFFINDDFLHFQAYNTNKFSFIAGNPPYIKKTLLTTEDIEICKSIHQNAKLNLSSFKNIWSAFLIRCCDFVEDDGVVALILPAELLQVKYSAELRQLLVDNFERTEIFTFDDLLFECKGQDTVLFIGYKRAMQKGQFFTNINNASQLTTGGFGLHQNIGLTKTNTKWTHHLLPSDDLTFIYNLKNRVQNVEFYCDSKPGIVTAANSYFIVNDATVAKYQLNQYAKPIIQKALFVNGSVEFNSANYQELANSEKPSKILCFNGNELPFKSSVSEYLKIGEDLDLASGYKCKQRANWYVVPNISTIPQGFFFKRSHHYPKIIKNTAKVLVTDSAYKIELKVGFDIDSLIYSFYNSLTLTFAELTGRYYGGGVLELTPQEFKKLPLPYTKFTDQSFAQYASDFKNKSDISDILIKNDYSILHRTLGLNQEEIFRINNIYKVLTCKRFRTNSP